ncbi:MAG: hypothetical protein IPK82_08005 [Polyangiaceae bacterium]|nr:hypothetical protein [Polyangiaceae bacterium]
MFPNQFNVEAVCTHCAPLRIGTLLLIETPPSWRCVHVERRAASKRRRSSQRPELQADGVHIDAAAFTA